MMYEYFRFMNILDDGRLFAILPCAAHLMIHRGREIWTDGVFGVPSLLGQWELVLLRFLRDCCLDSCTLLL